MCLHVGTHQLETCTAGSGTDRTNLLPFFFLPFYLLFRAGGVEGMDSILGEGGEGEFVRLRS